MDNGLLLITNDYGAKLVTCEAHRAEQEKYLLGNLTVAPAPAGECASCRTAAIYAELPALARASLLSPNFSHSRFRTWCGAGVVYIYHFDTASPTGVMLVVSIDEARFNIVYNELRATGQISGTRSPLSPTEAR